ncbi:hypothetical protein Tco_0694152 [Tanacetum coccineum]
MASATSPLHLRKIKPQKHLQCLRMISAQIELLTERALIHDAQNKGVQRNQQAFYYLEKAYQLQPDALYLMGAISLTVECVKKDIASAYHRELITSKQPN